MTALGGAVGAVLAALSVRLLGDSEPAVLTRLNHISMDPTVLLFALAIVLLTSLVFGLIPARSASQGGVADSLKQEVRTTTTAPAGQRLRRVLVMAELCMALMLLAGAGLLIKDFRRLRTVDPGFDPANVLSIYIQLPATRFAEIPRQISFRRELLARLNTLSGVQAAMIGDLPLSGSEVTHNLAFEGRPPVAAGDEPEVDTFCVMGDYFGVMRIPVIFGRGLTEMDRENQPLVTVINQALARQFFPGENPVGKRIRFAREMGPPRWMTIVGVVGDVKQYSLAEPSFPAVWTPFAQTNESWRRWMSVVLRTSDSSGRLIQSVKREIWSLDRHLPLNRIQSLDELLRISLAERRFNMFLLGIFAALATILSAVGIYGVMSYGISQRTHEIGIRVAIGAGPSDVLGMVMKEGAQLAAIGLGVGLIGTLALTRVMRNLLFGVTPTDPATLAAVVALTAAVVLLACWIPARRAMKVDPLVALRDE